MRICPACLRRNTTYAARCRGCKSFLDYFDVDALSKFAQEISDLYEIGTWEPVLRIQLGRPQWGTPHVKKAKRIPDELIIIVAWILREIWALNRDALKQGLQKYVGQLQGKLLRWFRAKPSHFQRRQEAKRILDSKETRIQIINFTIEHRYNITVPKAASEGEKKKRKLKTSSTRKRKLKTSSTRKRKRTKRQ